MLAILGFFPFSTRTIPFHSLDQTDTYKHPATATVGSLNPPSQFTGKEPNTLTLQAELRPEVTGSITAIDTLKRMADTGKAWPLIKGNGQYQGAYKILSIQHQHSEFMADGTAQAISFTLELQHVGDRVDDLIDEGLRIAQGLIQEALT